MPDDHNNDNDFTEDIYPEKPEFAKEEFKEPPWAPWHKPRKQWLRHNQWNKEIGNLIGRLRLTDRPLAYLSLPGKDLLDFRMVIELCKHHKKMVKCVGFNDPNHNQENTPEKIKSIKQDIILKQSSLFASYHEVVVPTSEMHFDDFNRISDTESVAYDFAERKGPYDIVNLDLCSSFSGIDKKTAFYEATFNLLGLQVRNRIEPWVFLLTSRSDREKVNIADFHNFWKNIQKNATQSADFKSGLEDNYLTGDYDGIGDIGDYIEQLTSPKFEKLFGLCIGKWLLSVINTSQRWTVKSLDSYWYRTGTGIEAKKHPNMLSLAFLFEKIPDTINDPAGLAQAENQQPQARSEEAQAIEMLNMINQLTDIDMRLHNNTDEFDEYILKSKELLEQADYNTDSYKNWAIKVLPVIPDGSN